MDEKQFKQLMHRLDSMAGYLETLVLEGREQHHEVIQKLDSIDAGVMLPDASK